jgi:DNA-binding NarL/FixJ family response regulator
LHARVLIVDDHDVVRRGIRSVICSDPELEIVGEAATGEDAVRKAGELKPDLVLLDISLPDISGIEVALRIRRLPAVPKILFLSQHDSIQVANEGLKSGACGFVAKADAARELLNAILTVLHGGTFLSARLTANGTE